MHTNTTGIDIPMIISKFGVAVGECDGVGVDVGGGVCPGVFLGD